MVASSEQLLGPFSADRKPTDRDPWLSLLAAARGGCSESLGKILDACRRYLLLVANQSLSPDLQAKAGGSDLVQETLLEAGKCFERFQGETEGDLLAWLQGILQNRLGTLKRQFNTRKRGIRREISLDGNNSSVFSHDLPDDGRSPSSWASAREDAEILNEALGRLPRDYAAILRLRNQQGLTFVEIGARMGRSTDAVRKLWGRAVECLEAQMEPPHGTR